MKPETDQLASDPMSMQDLANNSPPLNPQTPENPVSAGSSHPAQMFQPDVLPPPNPGYIPQQPPNPLQSFPPQKKRLPRIPKRLAALLATLVFIGLAAGAAWYFFKPADPNTALNNALLASLSMKSMQIDQSSDISGFESGYEANSVTKIDTSDIQNPKVSSMYVENYDGEETRVESYATKSKSLLKYSLPDSSQEDALTSIDNKWVDIRNSIDDGYDTYNPLLYVGLNSTSVETATLGYVVFGNFNDEDKTMLHNFILDNDVYSYNPGDVYSREVNNKKVYVYETEVNEAKLKELNRMAAKSMGLSEYQIKNTLSNIYSDVKIKFYVPQNDSRIVKIEVDDGSTTTELRYSGFNNTQLAQEPTAEISYEKYAEIFNNYLFSLDAPTTDPDVSPDDTERKTDINALMGHLEAYNAQFGRYPTLENLNDPNFRAEYMPGLDTEALIDPASSVAELTYENVDGTYSYRVSPAECDNGANGDCLQYTLSAMLDEGGTYLKQSLN